ncbi:Dna mismatch repair protein, C-terminal domain-containing protein [Cardiosporidium cionae]|uniref:Dna mismatch repair protein, C-terminal domain-containing protein n=1 Tax=Cardiosporidium cionae TaxID=476202 RepID=A0ABQ7JBN7_9APIC|nr:Dna mismatch repair protein, C-terminal domain-containing protein [Cardiosporidium cionae]|eukprot:KAF8821421.1 Dna mismatch repair protein, C-terminal domain-containing protein [Cardiosporidium cionae]
MSSPLDSVIEKRAIEGERHVHRLPEEVIRRIAAGEVIQRPSSALKELIENALDAGSTSIQISLQEGGLKRLDISDNGHGISQADLSSVCYRFTTSKLNAVEDLQKIQTFGFRGEALASISLVAHVTIQSKPSSASIGYTCDYQNTEPIEGSLQPSSCKNGTHITYEDLFYVLPTRRRSLRNTNEEYNRCLEIIQCYAIAYPTVSFSCKKYGSTKTDIYTMGNPSLSLKRDSDDFFKSEKTLNSQESSNSEKTMFQEENTTPTPLPSIAELTHLQQSKAILARIYGQAVAHAVLEFYFMKEWTFMPFKAFGLVSNTHYSSKKTIFILFINGRWVHSTQLRRALLAIYEEYLPRGGKPWIYLSLYFSPDKIDVNVHPTKHEIKFLYEQDIISCLASALRERLKSTKTSNIYKISDASTFPASKNSNSSISSNFIKNVEEEMVKEEENVKTSLSSLPKLYLNPTRVRVDVHQSSLTAQGTIILPSRFSQNSIKREKKEENTAEEIQFETSSLAPAFPATFLAARNNDGREQTLPLPPSQSFGPIKRLLALMDYRCDKLISKQVTESVYIGALTSCVAFLQHQSKLLAVHLQELVKECIYQSIISHLGVLPFFLLENEDSSQISIYKSLEEALKFPTLGLDSSKMEASFSLNDKVRQLEQQLIVVSSFLKEYFSLIIEDGYLKSLPGCCGNYFPGNNNLSMLLLRLAAQVNWEDSLLQFDSVARILADFFVQLPSSNSGDRNAIINEKEPINNSPKDTLSRSCEDFTKITPIKEVVLSQKKEFSMEKDGM